MVIGAYNYRTNNSGYSIEFEIYKNQIQFKQLPLILKNKEVLIFLKDRNGEEYCRKYFRNLQNYVIDGIQDGIYYLQIYVFDPKSGQYWSFLNEHSIALSWAHNRLIIVKHPHLYSNLDGLEKFANRNYNNQGLLRPTNQIQSNDNDIVKVSKEITRGIMTSYNKALAIHDWVSSNVYYDIDAYRSGQYITNDNSAVATLKHRCGVCQGYSNLTIALLRAIGLYSAEIPCNSSIDEITKGWKVPEENRQNHVISAVLIGKRWILMDVTWDSDNIKTSNVFKHRTEIGVTHLFFDPTMEFISATHQLFF